MKIFRLLFIFLVSLVPMACQSSLLTDLAVPSGERLYWDDFSDVSGGWPEYAQTEGSVGYAGGAYRISVTSPGYQMWAVSGQAYRDVQVEVDAARLAGPLANLYGLVCRYHGEENFYFFIISSDGYYTIGKMRGGQAVLLGQEMMAYSAAILQDGSPHRLRFDCIGSTLTGYINGQMVAMTSDSAFRDGDAGLIAGSFDEGGVEMSFDNFVVYKP